MLSITILIIGVLFTDPPEESIATFKKEIISASEFKFKDI
jgi:hypothetical protein